MTEVTGMPRANRKAAVKAVATWLSDLSNGRLTARQTRSPLSDIELLDERTGMPRRVKIAVCEFRTADIPG